MLLGVLLALILKMNVTLSDIKISSSLATFLGALLGAGISGSIAIYVMHKDISFRREEKQNDIKNNFEKSFELIQMWTTSYQLSVGSMNKLLYSQGGKAKKNLKQELEAIKKCKASLDAINDDYIPRETYKYFLELKSYMEMTYHQYNAYVSTIELFDTGEEFLIAKENEPLKEWLLKSYKENREYTQQRFFEIADYKSKL